MERIELKLESLSPVHISDWKTLSKFEYIIDGDKVRVIDFTKLMEKLDIGKIKSLERISEEYANVGRFNNEEALRELGINLNDIPIAREIKHRNLEGYLEIRQFVRMCDGVDCSYIPGSSIKGSIRTSWAFDYLTRERERLIQEIRRNKKRAWNNLNQTIFGRTPHEDVFRNVSVSDSNLIKDEELEIYVAKRYNLVRGVFQVPQCLECIRAGSKIDGITISSYESSRDGIDLHKIFQKTNEFHEKIVDFELSQNRIPEKLRNFYENLKEEFNSLREGEEMIIRIGFGTQFHSKTLWTLINEMSDRLSIGDVRWMIHKRARPRVRQFRDYPTTRLIVEMDGIYYPLGWVKLTKKESEE
ncbi:MAG TPA: type III-A CRISPR-associated RAMP protein Csm5 [Euryarchaeota archaeon]|nr:type III-A CRISPR-associated RAMP protein Csm5 [Euryarchaeota archaeon]